MLEALVGKDSQRGGHAYAVVGTERGAFGLDPLAVDIGGDGLCGEVKALVIALAHHVHVPLKYHGRGILVTGSGGYAEHDVTDRVGLGGYAVLLGKVKKVGTNLLFLLGRTRNAGDFVKNRKDSLGLQIFNFHDI